MFKRQPPIIEIESALNSMFSPYGGGLSKCSASFESGKAGEMHNCFFFIAV